MGTKRAYDFKGMQEKYSGYDIAHLAYARRDAYEAALAMKGHDAMAENWYIDDYFTICQEIAKR